MKNKMLAAANNNKKPTSSAKRHLVSEVREAIVVTHLLSQHNKGVMDKRYPEKLPSELSSETALFQHESAAIENALQQPTKYVRAAELALMRREQLLRAAAQEIRWEAKKGIRSTASLWRRYQRPAEEPPPILRPFRSARARLVWVLLATFVCGAAINAWQPVSAMFIADGLFLSHCTDAEIAVHEFIVAQDPLASYKPVCQAQMRCLRLVYNAGNIANFVFFVVSFWLQAWQGDLFLAVIGQLCFIGGLLCIALASVAFKPLFYVLGIILTNTSTGFVICPAGDVTLFYPDNAQFVNSAIVAASAGGSFLTAVVDATMRMMLSRDGWHAPGDGLEGGAVPLQRCVKLFTLCVAVPIGIGFIIAVPRPHTASESAERFLDQQLGPRRKEAVLRKAKSIEHDETPSPFLDFDPSKNPFQHHLLDPRESLLNPRQSLLRIERRLFSPTGPTGVENSKNKTPASKAVAASSTECHTHVSSTQSPMNFDAHLNHAGTLPSFQTNSGIRFRESDACAESDPDGSLKKFYRRPISSPPQSDDLPESPHNKRGNHEVANYCDSDGPHHQDNGTAGDDEVEGAPAMYSEDARVSSSELLSDLSSEAQAAVGVVNNVPENDTKSLWRQLREIRMFAFCVMFTTCMMQEQYFAAALRDVAGDSFSRIYGFAVPLTVATSLLYGFIADRVNTAVFGYVTVFLWGLAYTLTPWTPSLVAVLGVLIGAVGVGFNDNLDYTFVTNFFQDNFARLLSVTMICRGLASAATAVLSSFEYTRVIWLVLVACLPANLIFQTLSLLRHWADVPKLNRPFARAL